MKKILLVGCGHMGSTLLKAWINIKSIKISIVDPKNHSYLKKKHKKKIIVYKNNREIKKLKDYNIIVFAVKPQIAKKVVNQYKFANQKNTLFLSIMAGKRISFFEKNLFKPLQIIRAMPNMPALVNYGMTCLNSNKFTSQANKVLASKLFDKVGKTIWLKNENHLDKVTAISGSGPGYFFLFIEHLLSESLKLGLNKKIVKLLVYQTALGSINLLLSNDKSAKELRKNIAIQGGTTEAAINAFEKNNNFKKLVNQALKAAYFRSKFLSKNN